MAWRNQGITGSNNIPLGRRRFGGDDVPDDESRTATPASVGGDNGIKRGRSPVRGMYFYRLFNPGKNIETNFAFLQRIPRLMV